MKLRTEGIVNQSNLFDFTPFTLLPSQTLLYEWSYFLSIIYANAKPLPEFRII